MPSVDLPTASDFTELTEHRDDASVSIYLPSSPLPRETAAVRIALKNAVTDAAARLEGSGIDSRRIAAIIEPLRALDSDDDFWRYQARSLAIFAAPGMLRTFRLANRVNDQLAVGDRFDVGPLLRAITFANAGYVLSVTEGRISLYGLGADFRPTTLELPGLPDDLHTVLEHAQNFGQADMQRAAGATGQKIEQQRYCRLVQDAVLDRIGSSTLPMILNATDDLAPAYRTINTYAGLLARGIEANPESLTPDDLDARSRMILDEHYTAGLAEWRERFGTRTSNGRGSSKLAEVALAATAGAVEELLFDMDSTVEGTIDEQGVLEQGVSGDGVSGDAPGSATYNVVDEIAVRVLRSGGTVRAVRADDLPNESPVAAVLRFPLDGQ